MAKTIERSALVWYSAEQMYELVNDIAAYPEFLPWCADAEVHSASEAEILASLEISKGGVRQRFTTRNLLQTPNEIHMGLVDGPFSSLNGAWRFQPLRQNACKVQLELEFEVSGTLARMALGSMFSQAATQLVDAFCQRAREVYGEAGE